MRVLTENEIRNLTRRTDSGGKFNLPAGTILTPLARDYLRSRGIDIVDAHAGAPRAEKASGEDVIVDAVASEVTRLLREGGAKTPPLTPPFQGGESSRSAPQGAAATIPSRTFGSGSSGSANRDVVWGIGGDLRGV